MKFKPMWLLNYVLADPGNLEKLGRREKVLAFDQLLRVANPITKAALKVLKNANWQDFALVEDRVALANSIERSRGGSSVPLDGAGLAAAFRQAGERNLSVGSCAARSSRNRGAGAVSSGAGHQRAPQIND